MSETTQAPIIQALNAYPELKLAVLFGSMARGTETADSDLDLAVQADQPLSVEQKMGITETLALEFNRSSETSWTTKTSCLYRNAFSGKDAGHG